MAPMPRAHALDLLRLLASLALAFGHLTSDAQIPASFRAYLLAGLSSTLFFLLSGFAVAISTSFWRDSIWRNAAQRTWRLLPPHWFAFGLLLPLAITGEDRISNGELRQTLLWWLPGLQGIMPPGISTIQWNFPAWAITPLLIGGLTLPWMRFARLNTAKPVALWLLLTTFFALRLAHTLWNGAPADLPTYFHLHFALLPRLLEVYVGALVALLLAQHRVKFLERDTSFLLCFAIPIALLIAFTKLGGDSGKFYYTHGLFVPLGLLLLAAAYRNQGAVARLAAHPVLVYLASVSILIWLFHIPIDTYWKRGWLILGASLEWVQSFPSALLSFLATIAFASLCRPLLLYRPFRPDGKQND
jgi:peptidoglycan/LPS O-acetylase OafA/YrhL